MTLVLKWLKFIVSSCSSFFQVYEALTKMEGVDVYRKEDIPEEFHVAEALYMHEILLWAKMGEKHVIGLLNLFIFRLDLMEKMDASPCMLQF